MNHKNEIVEHVKGSTEDGFRYIPLTDRCKEILQDIKRVNPDSEYLFIRDGKPIVTCTFNRILKKCCEEIGIRYLSSQKIRFSTASILNENNVKDTELQGLLGHSDIHMTHHYTRNITPKEETVLKYKKALDKK